MLASLCILMICVPCLRFSESNRLSFLVLAGISMGILGLTHYMSLALLLPAIAWWAVLAGRQRLKSIVASLTLAGTAIHCLSLSARNHRQFSGAPTT